MATPKDPYALLGVSKSATDEEIRRAYRKLARKWHPDVNPGKKDAEERFKDVSWAYDVLSNQEKRKLYDEFGEEGLRGGFDPEQARAYRRWAEGRARTRGPAPEVPFELNVDDLFGSDLFGGLGGAGGVRARRRPAVGRGEDLQAVVELDFAQALRGTEVEAQVPVEHTCPTCGGAGNQPGTSVTTCPRCGGSGQVEAVRGPMRLVTTCPVCSGTGKARTPCATCGGTGTVASTEAVRVRIPPGADDGSKLVVRGRGLPGAGGGPPGDLVVTTRVRPHPFFRRDGLDLHLRLPVTLDEAYAGARVEVPTPDGPVQLKIPPRSQAGTRLRLRGRGVARGGEKGDLYVELEVRVPEREDARLADALRAARGLYERPVREGIRL
jgi:molecular chaperone DnaJ